MHVHICLISINISIVTSQAALKICQYPIYLTGCKNYYNLGQHLHIQVNKNNLLLTDMLKRVPRMMMWFFLLKKERELNNLSSKLFEPL